MQMTEAETSCAGRLRSAQLAICLLLAALPPVILYWYQGAFGLNFADEGFVWYGAQRVLHGEVPIRDFLAYDLARYYWYATSMQIVGNDGVLAVRKASLVLQILGALLGAYLVLRRDAKPSYILALLTSTILVLWMWPDYKVFDHFASLVNILAVTIVLERSTPPHFFASGILLGLAALMGRNHGVYGLVAAVAAFVFLAFQRERREIVGGLCAWSLGVVVGYAPMFWALATITGFASAFWDSIAFLFEASATNIALPFPMPWNAAGLKMYAAHHLALISLSNHARVLLFYALFVFAALGLGYVVRNLRSQPTSINATFVAAALLALPYAHYTLSRTDHAHLAFGIFPFLIGVLTTPLVTTTRWRLLGAATLLAVTVLVSLPVQLRYRAYRDGGWSARTVRGDNLILSERDTKRVELFNGIGKKYLPSGERILVVPYWPGAYAILGQQAPNWEIYADYSRRPSFELAEIARIELARPAIVVFEDNALDDRENLRFRATHPLTERYIRETFDPVTNVESLPPNVLVFKRRS